MEHHEPGTIRSDLVKMVYRAWVLNEMLEAEVAQPVGRGIGGGLKSASSGSKAPWNALAANLVTELHTQSRRMESDLNFSIVGRTPQRGTSDRNTWLALYRITDLVETVSEGEVLGVLVQIRTWVGKAEVALGQAEPVRRLPREFGCGEPGCPWCGFMTLRCHVCSGTVFCVNPGCRDDEGARPQATIGVSEMGDLNLVWQNGVSIIPRPPLKEAA